VLLIVGFDVFSLINFFVGGLLHSRFASYLDSSETKRSMMATDTVFINVTISDPLKQQDSFGSYMM
jgi:hypothetical protein